MIEDIVNGCGGVSPSDVKNVVTDLSVKHGVLSKYTAFVAIGTGGEALEASMVARRVQRKTESSYSRSTFSYSRPAGGGMLKLFGRKRQQTPQDQLSRLRESQEMLEKREQFIQRKIQEQVATAKRYNDAGNKTMAVAALKRKKMLMDQQRRIEVSSQNIAAQIATVQSGATTAPMPVQQTGSSGMCVDRVDKVMDGLDDTAVQAEISDALSQPVGEVIDEDELLEELDGIDEEELECEPPPSRCKAKPRSTRSTEEDDLAELAAALGDDFCSSSPPKPAVKPEPVPKPAVKPVAVDMTKSLDNVIMQQKASGCFNALALQLLDVPESAKNARPAKLPDGMDEKLAEDIWITLLVLVGMEKKFGDKKSEWSFLAKKSENWAKSKLSGSYDAWMTAAKAAF